MKENQNILISRTDAIGDVVLSLPVAGALKTIFPNCRIFFLGQTYTKDIIESCSHIEKFLDWNELNKLNGDEQVDFIKKYNINIALHIFPNIHIARLIKKAGIPIRIGTSHRWYHWFLCNQQISFSRRKSNLHEAQLNTNLLIPLGLNQLLSLGKIATLYGIVPPAIENNLISLYDTKRFNLILHPKSRGSGKEWSLENYSKLIGLLDPKKFKIFVTGTQSEHDVINKEILFNYPEVIDLTGKMTLKELIGFISKADGLVASGTGPLHIAAATGIHAIGLYPPVKPINAKRWAPVGINARSIEADKICVNCYKGTRCDCLDQLSANFIADYLAELIKPGSPISHTMI